MTMTHIPDEAVQAMPERIYASAPSSKGCVVSFDIPSLTYDIEYIRADIAVTHLSAPCAVEVPEGWQLVPKVPTFEMAKAAIDLDPKSDLDAKYKAMLSAAPQVVTKPVNHSELLGNSEQLKPVDVAAVRRQAFDEVKSLCVEYGNDSQPDSEYRLSCNDLIEAICAIAAEPAQ